MLKSIKENMKKNIAFLVVLILIFSTITVLIINFKGLNKKQDEQKLEIVATLFPQYDFVKQVGGDKVNVTLILPPGTESHAYEPTPQDMVKINRSNLFIYTGEEMEPWAENLISGMKDDISVIDLSKTVELINSEEFEEEHTIQSKKTNEHHEEHDEHDEHNHTYDPHIWLNPQYAAQMVQAIADELCRIDPENAEYYTNNASQYIAEITALDGEFENTINNAKNKRIAFGGAFAYAYFIERYNLDFISAYQTCGENTEPSTTQLKNVISYMKKYKIPVIFYKEYTNGKVAQTIAESTNAQMLVFNTVHNVSKEEIENGATYVSIMRQNLENLKIALQ